MSNTDQRGKLAAQPFSYQATKQGILFLSCGGRVVTTLKGKAADKLRAALERASPEEEQLLLAKATGHFKHGNER